MTYLTCKLCHIGYLRDDFGHSREFVLRLLVSYIALLYLASCQQMEQIKSSSQLGAASSYVCSKLNLQRMDSAKIKNQLRYEAAFSKTVQVSMDMLGEGKQFFEIEQYLKKSRKEIQYLLLPHDPKNSSFGLTRAASNGDMEHHVAYTPFAAKADVHPGGLARVKAALSGEKSFGFKRGDDISGFQNLLISQKSPLDPKKTIELTQYFVAMDSERKIESLLIEPKLINFISKYETVITYHTAASELPEVIEVIEYLFTRALDDSLPEEELLQRIGEFHWWFSNAMPYKRGSAAIGKMFVATLLNYHSVSKISLDDLHKFSENQGIDIDVWAMTMGDSKLYSKKYADAITGDYQIAIPDNISIQQ